MQRFHYRSVAQNHQIGMRPIALAFLITLATLFGCAGRKATYYRIPAGYVGWIKVYYSVKSAPPLLQQNGSYVITVAQNGTFETSSPPEFGAANDKFYYYTQNADKEIGDDLVLSGIYDDGQETSYAEGRKIVHQKHPPLITYFIGTEAEFKRAQSP